MMVGILPCRSLPWAHRIIILVDRTVRILKVSVLFFISKVDLDLGNYERFLDMTLTKDNNITTGKIYQVCHLVFYIDSV